MSRTEFSVQCSETIAGELLARGQDLVSDGESMAALYEHLGYKVPETVTADLVYPGNQLLWPLGKTTLTEPLPIPEVGLWTARMDYLQIMMGEISEEYILRQLTQTLIKNEALSRRRNGIIRGASLTVGSIGAGSIVQEAGSNWGFAGAGVGAILLGATSLYARRPYTFRPLPDLSELAYPIRVVPQG